MRSQDVIHIPLGVKIPIHNHQWRPVPAWYGGPHHHTWATPPVGLTHATIGISLASSSPDTLTPIRTVHTEPWLIAESDLVPLCQGPPLMLLAPSLSVAAMGSHHHGASVWSSGSQTIVMQSSSCSIIGDPWVCTPRSCRSAGCWTESIPQVT